jgi:hypothetical protein
LRLRQTETIIAKSVAKTTVSKRPICRRRFPPAIHLESQARSPILYTEAEREGSVKINYFREKREKYFREGKKKEGCQQEASWLEAKYAADTGSPKHNIAKKILRPRVFPTRSEQLTGRQN